jgi:glycosyltransferase involved in cell wall biosynthesis
MHKQEPATTLVLIPAFNEAENIKDVIKETRKALPGAHICVLDDGSTDNTRHILSQILGITVLHHPYNAGIGGAIWTGFHFFLKNNFDYLVRIDGDGQHPPEQGKFLKKEGFQSSLTRRGGIKLLNMLSSFILKKDITDNTSGFRAYNRKAVTQLLEDFPFDYPEPVEVYLLAKKGLHTKEVPVVMRQRQAGLTSIGWFDTTYYLVKVFLTILIKYLFGGK